MRRLARFPALLLCTLMVLIFLPGSATQAAVQRLPGDKPYFVVALHAAKYNATFGRLAEWTFNGATGKVSERFWAWNQGMAPSGALNAFANREHVASTYGCEMVAPCKLYAPSGFRGAGTVRSGNFTNNGKHVSITWPTGVRETYQIINHPAVGTKGAYVELGLTSHTYTGVSQVQSRAYGSTRPFNQGVSSVSPASWPKFSNPSGLTSNLWEQNWNSVTKFASQPFDWSHALNGYNKCSASNCVVNKKRRTWHSYLYFFGKSSRKVAWMNMVNAMVKGEKKCIPVQDGGHNWAMLQVIDDNGNFRGLVGIEASLYHQSNGSSIVSGIWAIDN